MDFPDVSESRSSFLLVESCKERDSDVYPASISGLKILLSIESAMYRQCVAVVLKRALHESAVCTQAPALDGETRPDLILAEVHATRDPAAAIENVFRRLPESCKGQPVVALSDVHDVDIARAALRAGFRGFLSPLADLDTAIAAIRLVIAGGVYVPSDLLNMWVNDKTSLVPDLREPTIRVEAPAPVPSVVPITEQNSDRNFTERELEVIERLRMGKPNKIIAFELDITESTVKVHIRNIMRKLSATNRTQVAFLTREILKTPACAKPNLLCNGIVVGQLAAERIKPLAFGS